MKPVVKLGNVAVDIVTKEDLEQFRVSLIQEIKKMWQDCRQPATQQAMKGLKTKEVRSILGCSYNTLVALRISKKIRTKKIGGALYYNREDVRRLVEGGFDGS